MEPIKEKLLTERKKKNREGRRENKIERKREGEKRGEEKGGRMKEIKIKINNNNKKLEENTIANPIRQNTTKFI